MIIRGADGDDERQIVDMEEKLCRKYRLGRRLLYPTLAHADFHQSYKDPERYWTVPCYAAFSGQVLTHKLAHGPLNALLEDFERECGARRASWQTVMADAVMAGSSDRHNRNHCAVAFRYACCVSGDYIWPAADLPGRLTEPQLAELNRYLEYVEKECRIPAGKPARLACQRQLADLAKSGGVVSSSTPERDFAAKARNRRGNEHNN